MNGIHPSGSGSYGSGSYGSGAKPIFESVSNYDGSGPGASGFGTTGFGGVNSLGSGGGSFHSTNPDYYKKALKGSPGINSINSYGNPTSSYGSGGGGSSSSLYGGASSSLYSAGANNYQESARQDNFDCVCVPFDQCPARDVLGRKGDLILPLDPRNLGSDIEAEDSNKNSNSTVTRVTKEASTAPSDDDDDESAPTEDVETTQEDVKRISKREAADKKSDEFQKSDGEAVSIQYLFITHKSFHLFVISNA